MKDGDHDGDGYHDSDGDGKAPSRKIKVLYVVLSTDEDGSEHPAGYYGKDGTFRPLLASDMARVEQILMPPARDLARQGHKVSLVKFTHRTEMGQIKP